MPSARRLSGGLLLVPGSATRRLKCRCRPPSGDSWTEGKNLRFPYATCQCLKGSLVFSRGYHPSTLVKQSNADQNRHPRGGAATNICLLESEIEYVVEVAMASNGEMSPRCSGQPQGADCWRRSGRGQPRLTNGRRNGKGLVGKDFALKAEGLGESFSSPQNAEGAPQWSAPSRSKMTVLLTRRWR